VRYDLAQAVEDVWIGRDGLGDVREHVEDVRKPGVIHA
jgi:hypothetical protein